MVFKLKNNETTEMSSEKSEKLNGNAVCCELCAEHNDADKFFNIFEVYITLRNKTSLIYELMNELLKNKILISDSPGTRKFLICNTCCSELETTLKFLDKLKKIDSLKIVPTPPEEPKNGSLKPNFMLTKTVSSIVAHVNKIPETPQKRKLEEDFEVTTNEDKKIKMTEQNNKLAIPCYKFENSENEKNVKILNVIPMEIQERNGQYRFDEKEISASKDSTSKILYKCKYCSKYPFSTEHNLLIHVKFEHLCVFCLKCFRNSSTLSHHVKQHHPKLLCTICQTEFDKKLIKNHLKSFHKLDLPLNVNLISMSDQEKFIDS